MRQHRNRLPQDRDVSQPLPLAQAAATGKSNSPRYRSAATHRESVATSHVLVEAERNLKSAAALINRPAPGFLQNGKTESAPGPAVRDRRMKEWLIAGGVCLLSSLVYVLAFPPFPMAEGA